jgi:type III pantothenate kinase
MRLVLDAGNSTIAAATADGERLLAVRRLPIGRASDEAALESALGEAFGLDGRDRADGTGGTSFDWGRLDLIALGSVVPSATAAVAALASRHDVPLVLATPDVVPLPIRVAHPERVGPDRLLNALAAARIHGTPAVVVDVGTATTWECVDAEGAFVGGAIAPGLQLGLRALAERTALLPRVAPTLPERAIGRDTVEAIRSGTVLGHRELVEGLTRRIRAELADVSGTSVEAVRTVLTGGMAATTWGESLEGFAVRDPDLTLRGLAIVAEASASPAVAR